MKTIRSLFAVAALLAACALPVAAQSANTATITFAPPSTLADGTAMPSGAALTYNVYQGIKGQAKAKVATISASPASVATGLSTGNAYCFELTSVLNGLESARSNEGCKSFIPAGTFTITVQ